MAELAQIKRLFFDRKKVVNAADRAKRQALSKFGAFVRQRAKTSMRTKKGVSPVGSPPFAHTKRLRNAIFFAYDPSSGSVVIGPVQAGKSGDGARVLEEGGTLSVPGVRGGRALRYRPRPYMKPAFDAELPKAAAQFKGLIRG